MDRIEQLDRLSRERFDVLVIGAGVNGAAIAHDAATRGLKVAVIDKGDIGGATSSGCFKIIHGGFRYLQHLNIRRLRESVEEQRVLRKIAPQFITPLSITLPCYGFGMRSKEVLSVALLLYGFLTLGKNRGVRKSRHLPWFETHSRSEMLEMFPHLAKKGLRGGVSFFDGQISNCERFTFSFAKSAMKHQAIVSNYVEAVGAKVDPASGGTRLQSVITRDVLTGNEFEIEATTIVSASGPWFKDTIASLSGRRRQATSPRPFSKGLQLVVPRIYPRRALALESRHPDESTVVSRGGRSYFIVPWGDFSLVGTGDYLYRGDPDDYRLTGSEVESFIEEVNEAVGAEVIDKGRVYYAFGGLRPLAPEVERKLDQLADDTSGGLTVRRIALIEERFVADGIANLVAVEGVKYTTARALAEQVVDLVVSKLGTSFGPCRTKDVLLPGAFVDGDESFYLDQVTALAGDLLSEKDKLRLLYQYGSEALDICRYAKGAEYGFQRVSPECSFLRAELEWILDTELVVRLSDIVFRRSDLSPTIRFLPQIVDDVAKLVANKRQWSEEEREREIERVWGEFSRSGLSTSVSGQPDSYAGNISA